MPAGLAGSRRTATRVTRASTCLSSSSHFALMPYSNEVKPVYVAARASEACDKAGTNRVDDTHEDLLHHPHSRTTRGQHDVRRNSDQLRHVFANALWIGRARSDVDPHIASVRPTQLLQLMPGCRYTVQKHWITFGHTRAHGDER
jgi:hypothetical protein